MTMEAPPLYVSIKEGARLLGVSRGTVERMIREGHLPAVRLGPRQTRIPVSVLEALAERPTGIRRS